MYVFNRISYLIKNHKFISQHSNERDFKICGSDFVINKDTQKYFKIILNTVY